MKGMTAIYINQLLVERGICKENNNMTEEETLKKASEYDDLFVYVVHTARLSFLNDHLTRNSLGASYWASIWYGDIKLRFNVRESSSQEVTCRLVEA